MYHRIVKQITRQNFEHVAAGNLDAVLAGCIPAFRHSYQGETALGGERNTREDFRLWMERVHRLTPKFYFELHDILVSGGPWNTRVVVKWTKHTTGPDGVEYPSWGIHIITLKWFRGVSIDVYPDTASTAEELFDMARQGITEAVAPPIVS